jgi:hypothetical protein
VGTILLQHFDDRDTAALARYIGAVRGRVRLGTVTQALDARREAAGRGYYVLERREPVRRPTNSPTALVEQLYHY